MFLSVRLGGALGAFAFLGGIALAACSAPGGGNNEFGSKGNGGSSNGGGAGAGNNGNGGSSGGNLFGDSGLGGGSNDDGGSNCGGEDHQAQLIPLDMYIMQDQSGSMTSSNKWTDVTTALKAFVSDPASAGIGVGIQYFGLPCDIFASDSCNENDYKQPEIEIAPLPGNAPYISSSIDSHTINCIQNAGGTLTPTQAALQGAILHAKEWAVNNPSHTVVVVLATDGVPTECSIQDPVALGQQIAAPAANPTQPGVPKILTFVIGVGSETQSLDAIAQGGGTKQAFIVQTGANAEADFVKALNAIRGAALACNFQIPTPTSGAFKPNMVNVKYTPGGSATPTTIGKVADANSCGPNGGWYYDNDAAPTQIIMCPTTCTTLSSDTSGKVQIVLGCQTIPA